MARNRRHFAQFVAAVCALLIMFAQVSAAAAWESSPYADKDLNKMKDISIITRLKTYRNTITQMSFGVRNRGTKAIIIENGFYLERKTNDGWQRQSGALKSWFTKLPDKHVEIPGGIDGAAQTVLIDEKLANGEYRIAADAAFQTDPEKTYPITGSFTVADFGLADYDTEGWVPTYFSENELDTVCTFTMATEHPVYKPGTESVSLILKNKRKADLTYGVDFFLERKTESGWQHYFRPNVVFSTIGYMLWGRSSYAIGITFAGLPPLINGEYRIIKSFHYDYRKEGEFYATAYFSVSDDGYDTDYLSGYTPLEQLPVGYTEQEAINDGVLFVDAKGKLHNKSNLLSFLKRATQGLESKVRILRYDETGAPIFTDITFKSPYQIVLMQDRTRSVEKHQWANVTYNSLTVKTIDGKKALVVQNTDQNDAGEWIVLHNIALAGTSKVNGYIKKIN